MAIHIHNAGLVLIHPFLLTLFQQLKLIEKNQWIDEAAQHKAVFILEYLATGNEEIEELNLVLHKFLCGIDIDATVSSAKLFEDDIKKECEGLLGAVISHWSVLKNTSLAGLREAFLQRNGMLSRVDNEWFLKMDHKAYDILLSRLPYNIRVIKLPWMINELKVEW